MHAARHGLWIGGMDELASEHHPEVQGLATVQTKTERLHLQAKNRPGALLAASDEMWRRHDHVMGVLHPPKQLGVHLAFPLAEMLLEPSDLALDRLSELGYRHKAPHLTTATPEITSPWKV